MKNKAVSCVVLFVIVCLSPFLSTAFGEGAVDMKGYFVEEGAFVRQRVLEPLDAGSPNPILPEDLQERKKILARTFEGLVVNSKVSLPASRTGLVLDPDSPGTSNVELYRLINQHGAAVKKGERALITRFCVNGATLDVDINGGGYGNAGDVTARVLADLVTLGLRELKNNDLERSRRGSRVRVVLKGKHSADFSSLDVRKDAFVNAVALGGRPADAYFTTLLGISVESTSTVTTARLAEALNSTLLRADFATLAPAESIKLPRWSSRLLKEINRTVAKGKKKKSAVRVLSVKERRRLNRDILNALYPQAFRPDPGVWTSERLSVDILRDVLSPVLDF